MPPAPVLPSPPVAAVSPRSRRTWLFVHLATMVLAGGLIARAARGQWFYYDEWDFLREDAEWELLSPHNGHLSLLPRLTTTLIKGAVGLHEYWPYLFITVLVHLLLAHLLWRLMLRMHADPLVATISVFAFALLAPGSENVLWAFQVGFILPLATGAAALLIAMKDTLRRRDLVAIVALLFLGLCASGTALPMTTAVLLFVVVKHGWRGAMIAGASLAVPYGAWFLTFGMLPQGTSAFRAASVHDVLVRLPEYMSHGLVAGLAKTVPFPSLAGALLVGLAVFLLWKLTQGGLNQLSALPYLVFAALVFGGLTAFTRVQLPIETAAAGRYVYVYAALLLPAAVACLTSLVTRGRLVHLAVSAVLVLVAGYNVGGFMREAHVQSELELRVRAAISAAVELDDGGDAVAGRRPSPVWAPPLTMSDVREFVERGQFIPLEPSDADLLATRANLFLDVTPTERPPEGRCTPSVPGDIVRLDPELPLVESRVGTSLHIRLDDQATHAFVDVPVGAGTSRLSGLHDVIISVEIPSDGRLCVLEVRG